MPYGLTIEIDDTASQALQELSGKLSPGVVSNVVGGSVSRLLQDHFRDLDSARPNALGGKRTHYFAAAARSVAWEADDDGATVSIHQLGIGLHYFGGTVTPVNRKYLTIPARAEAHGRRAGEFDNLEVLWGRNGPYALAERWSQDILISKDRRKAHKGEFRTKVGREHGSLVFYWLVKSATMQPDPSILPTDDLIRSTAVSAIADHLAAKFGRRS